MVHGVGPDFRGAKAHYFFGLPLWTAAAFPKPCIFIMKFQKRNVS
jgi:hypothetical protein